MNILAGSSFDLIQHLAGNANTAAISDSFESCRDIDSVAEYVAVVGNDVPNIDANTKLYSILRRCIRQDLSPVVTFLGFCGAPWTLATYMIAGQGTPDQLPARLFAYRHPEAFAKLIEILVDASASYLVRQFTAGVDAVQIFVSHSTLDFYGAPHRVHRACKFNQHAVAGRLNDVSPMFLYLGIAKLMAMRF